MSIYTPYTYLIGWSSLNKYYYGRRTTKKCNPSELWIKYFTSSKIVKRFRIDHGEPDIIQIRQTFCNPKDCSEWECKVLERINAQHNQKFLNQKNGDYKWDFTNKKHTQEDILKQKNKQSKSWLLKFYDDKISLIKNLNDFCLINNIDSSSLIKVANNKIKHHKGIQCRYNDDNFFPFLSHEDILPTTYIITSPQNIIYEINNLNDFCKKFNLDISSIIKVSNNKIKHYKKWECTIKNNIKNKFYTPLKFSN